MKKIFKRKVQRGRLSVEQRDFFLKGYSHFCIGDPFKNKDRLALWKKYRAELMRAMYETHIHGNFHDAVINDLRPYEWFRVEAPEPRGVLNDAKRIGPEDAGLFDKEPILETDYEYLQRLGLLNDEDRAYVQTEAFKEAEKYAIKLREYLAKDDDIEEEAKG
jgi:hypothetical protein